MINDINALGLYLKLGLRKEGRFYERERMNWRWTRGGQVGGQSIKGGWLETIQLQAC